MNPENEVMLDALIAALDELIAEAMAQRAKLVSAKAMPADTAPPISGPLIQGK